MKVDFKEIDWLLQKLRANPYKIFSVETPHTGYIKEFKVKEGDSVTGPAGKWLEKPGTPLFILERERNSKIIRAHTTGIVQNLREDLKDKFVQAFEPILEIKHPLSQEEVISEVLLSALYVIYAEETARFILAPEISHRIEKHGLKRAEVRGGEDILIMTFMKREHFIKVKEGGRFIIYQVYFKPFELVPKGSPLIALCPFEDLPVLERIVARIREEWPS